MGKPIADAVVGPSIRCEPTPAGHQEPGHRKLVVCIHDVCPDTWNAVSQIIAMLHDDLGDMISLAAIPQPDGKPWLMGKETRSLIARLTKSPEVLLHGLTHRRRGSWSPMSQLIGRNDEFARLSSQEAAGRLLEGSAILMRMLRRPIDGVLPPAWCAGRIRHVYRQVGLRFIVGMSGVQDANRRLPLATWSWDAGPVRPLGHLLDLWGNVLSWRTSATPCLAIHPTDLRRRFLPRAMRILKRLIRAGYEPTTFGRLIAPSSVG